MVNLLETAREAIPQLYAVPFLRGEYKTTPIQTKDLLSLDQSSFNELVRQVYSNRRRATLLVHPFYRDFDPEARFPASDTYRQERDELITGLLHQGKPIIILERTGQYERLTSRVQSEVGILFAVRTRNEDATPAVIEEYLGDYPFWSPRELMRADWEAWSRAANILKDSGVKTLEIGGRYLGFHPITNKNGEVNLNRLLDDAKGKPNAEKWLQSRLIPGGCVGQVMHKLLERNFDIAISPVSSPARTVEATDFSDNPQVQNFF